MSEFSNGNWSNDLVFSDEYWQDSEPALPRDELFGGGRFGATRYPDLGVKVINYTGGEDGINLPAGVEFGPNGDGGEEWYYQPGTLSVFDWESLIVHTPESFAKFNKTTRGLIKQFSEVEDRIGLDTRQFLLHGAAALSIPGRTLASSVRLWTVLEREQGVATYQRGVWLGIIEANKGHVIGRNLLAIKSRQGQWEARTDVYSDFGSKQIPFLVGTAHEHPLNERSLGLGLVRSVERFKKVEVLEVGARAKSPQKALKKLTPSLGRLSLGLKG